MSDNRTPPFCCHRILPQTPFHKHENYPRAYTCVLDFLQLATRFPNQPPPSTHSKALEEHDFAIRLCKGQSDPRYGPNQWGPARYFLHDPDIQGSLVEICESSDEDQSSSLETLKALLHKSERIFGGFLFLEDVWMTVRCPLHSNAMWLLQFWTRGPRDSEHLEEVCKRVRCRLDNKPGFVEDPFTVRFNEMMGIPNQEAQQERESSGNPKLRGVDYGVNKGGDIGKFGEEQEELDSRQSFGAQREDLIRFPPGLQPSPSFGPPHSIPSDLTPSSLFRQPNIFVDSQQEAPIFPPGIWTLNRGLDHAVCGGYFHPQYNIDTTAHQPTIINEDCALGTKKGFLGTALHGEDPALRPGFASQLPNLAPPPDPSAPRHDKQQLDFPHPSRSFNVANMLQNPQPDSAQPSFPHQHVPVVKREPYGTYQRELIPPPNQRVPQDDRWEDISHQIMHPSRLSSLGSPPRDFCTSHRSTGAILPGSGDTSKTSKSLKQRQVQTEAARSSDTNKPDDSAGAPPPGITSGLRQVERRAWDDGNKEWRSYWVWAA